jgi:hypothetical protein
LNWPLNFILHGYFVSVVKLEQNELLKGVGKWVYLVVVGAYMMKFWL